MIGQGKVLASPLAMATVAASIAAGHTVVPHLVEGAQQNSDGSLTADEASVLRDFMYAVVDDGSAQFLDDMPGEDVGAKTGTAEFATDDGLKTHVWMIAIQGDLAVSVFVEEGDGGSHTAGPLLESSLS